MLPSTPLLPGALRGKYVDQDITLRDANLADAEALSALVTPLARHLLDADSGASAHAFLASLTPASFTVRALRD